jgi:hypothetical protein
MKYCFNLFLIHLFWIAPIIAENQKDALLQANMENSLQAAWQKKEVLKSKIIERCESLENWSAGGEAKISLNNSHAKEGNNAVGFLSSVITSNGKNRYPSAYLTRVFNGENWEKYNRLSFWVYAELKNTNFIYVSAELKNNGKEKTPTVTTKKGKNYIKVDTGKWTQIFWEIPQLPRDKITSLNFVYMLYGKKFAGIGDSVRFYVDKIELQTVRPDLEEGWIPAKDKIAYSHIGYSSGGSKNAIAGEVNANEFFVIDATSDEIAFRGNIKTTTTRFGILSTMDFSDLRKEGEYKIKAGHILSQSFKISSNIWNGSIRKNLNFWHTERCGTYVPGIHENCHRDVLAQHGDKQIVVNGGWHDAGDLTQMIYGTADAVYSMFDLAEHMQTRDSVLAALLQDEAEWGLEWILKTRFGDGFRHNFGGVSKYTDGIIGTEDDFVFKAQKQPLENFLEASVLARAALFLREKNPTLAQECLSAAEAGWQCAKEDISVLNVELCGTAVLASVQLFELTGAPNYQKKAIEWADVLLKSQRQTLPNWDIPLLGFFYKTPLQKQILRYNPIGNDQAPILSLKKLCRLFPDHPKWIEWYGAIAFYAEYIKKTTELANPFRMIPHSIYNVDETHHKSVYGLQQSTLAKYTDKGLSYQPQVNNGLELGGGHFLRNFPVWHGHRGSFGIIMSQAKGLAAASHLRNDLTGLCLAEEQLQWIVGKNPFSQSAMYGEGYDFPPLYSVSAGPIVGAIACGFQTNGDSDLPNWPASTAYNYKEIWTHTANRWLMLVKEAAGDPRLKNASDLLKNKIEFIEKKSGFKTDVKLNNQQRFYAALPAGNYVIRNAEKKMEMTFLPGRDYEIDFDKNVHFTISRKQLDENTIEVQVKASGKGMAKFELRGFNLSLENAIQKVTLSEKNKTDIRWKTKIISADKPWVAVVIVNDNFELKQEINNISEKLRNEK